MTRNTAPTKEDRDSAVVQPIVVMGPSHWPIVATAAIVSSTLLVDEALVGPPHWSRGSGPESLWAEWLTGATTKTVRRAKSSEAIDDVVHAMASLGYAYERTHVTDDHTGEVTEAVAFEPLRYRDFPKALKRLQVSGLDRPASGLRWDLHRSEEDEISDPAVYLSDATLVGKLHDAGPFLLDEDLSPVSTGKAAAQAAHALNLWVMAQDEAAVRAWRISPQASFRRFSPTDLGSMLGAEPRGELRWAAVSDHGLTEVDPGTVIAVVRIPDGYVAEGAEA